MKKRRIIVNLLLFLLVFEAVFSRIVVIKAAIPEGENMVRVGLTKEYYNKPSIRLDNSALKIGFSKKNVYYQADVLRSNTGISISRDYGSYNVFGGSFTTYAKAAAEAANLKAFNKTLTAGECGSSTMLILPMLRLIPMMCIRWLQKIRAVSIFCL